MKKSYNGYNGNHNDFAACFSFSKIAENKKQNKTWNTRSRKILRRRVFSYLFFILLSDILGNGQ